MSYGFPIKYIMLSREPVDYQRVTYSIVVFFPINYIMLNRKFFIENQHVIHYRKHPAC